MKLLALDPGNTRTAYVVYDTHSKRLVEHGQNRNPEIVAQLVALRDQPGGPVHLACEMVGCYGQIAGRTLFETCFWIGRFVEAWHVGFNLVLRRGRWGPGPEVTGAAGEYDGVTMCLCGSTRAKDKNVRQALIDRFPPTGGGKTPQIGTKAKPGALYGVSTDTWAALAVAITFAEAMRLARAKEDELCPFA